MRVLLVEDDQLLGEGLKGALGVSGFSVDWVQNGLAATHALLSEDYEACVLDLGLPGKDGLSVLRSLREKGKQTPVLILSARDTLQDKVTGLDAGADDYLLKPFELDELLARLRVMLRRVSQDSASQYRCGAVAIDPVTKKVMLGNQQVVLSSREYALLFDLMSHKGQPRSKQQLESGLYAWGSEVESNTVEVYIHRLRKKLGVERIETIRGFGYVMKNID